MNKLTALLATGRISNLPTVWCNVLVVLILVQQALNLSLLTACCIAASCLYVGGCFLGDAVDVEFDQKNKPSRPIPMGVLSRSAIYTSASALLTMGITIPVAYLKFTTGVWSSTALASSVLLTSAIVIYSLWHKRSPWIGLPFIGACRFFLVLFGALVAADLAGKNELSPAYVFASCVGIYTICFASVARSESSPKPITWRKTLMASMFILPLLPCFLLNSSELSAPKISATCLYWLWMLIAFRKINHNKGQFVSMSLAGFCLLDATFAVEFGYLWLIVCLVLFGFSLLLQKWAPAT